MLGKDISEALGGIAEDKIEAAAGIAPRNNGHVWLRVAAVAAVAVMVLTWLLWPGKPDVSEDDGVVKAPGMLRVYAFDLTSGAQRHRLSSLLRKLTSTLGWLS